MKAVIYLLIVKALAWNQFCPSLKWKFFMKFHE